MNQTFMRRKVYNNATTWALESSFAMDDYRPFCFLVDRPKAGFGMHRVIVGNRPVCETLYMDII